MKLKGNAYKPITSTNQVKFAPHNPESRTARRLKVTLLQLVFELWHRVMISAIWNLYWPILIWLIISWNIVWYHSISMHILDLVAWRHERLPRHSPYSLAKGRLFIWSYLIAFTAQLLLESFQSLFVEFQLHEYQAWHRYHGAQQIPPPANAKGTLQRKRSKCDCGPSTVGFDRFVQGWAANRVYNDSVGTAITIIDLINLINLIKSYLFTVGDC